MKFKILFLTVISMNSTGIVLDHLHQFHDVLVIKGILTDHELMDCLV